MTNKSSQEKGTFQPGPVGIPGPEGVSPYADYTYQSLENKALEELRDFLMYQSRTNNNMDLAIVDMAKTKDLFKSHLQLAYEAGEKQGRKNLLDECPDTQFLIGKAIAEVLEELKQELFPTGGVIDVDKFPDKVFNKLQELQNK